MPRLPRISHPLRSLRHILGQSQPEFAALVGVSRSTILSIENGRLELSRRLAHRIALTTGVHFDELLKGRRAKLLNRDFRPYRLSDYRRWNRFYEEGSTAAAEQLAEETAESLLRLFKQAARANKLRVTQVRILEALNQAAESLE